MGADTPQICTPLSPHAIDILYAVDKYFYICDKHFVNSGVLRCDFYHD